MHYAAGKLSKGRNPDFYTIPLEFLIKWVHQNKRQELSHLGKKKRLKRADRTYKDLKQKQKAKIADCMFEKTCDYYREHDKLPEGGDSEKIAEQIYQRVKGIAEKASFDEVFCLYLYRLPRYETM